MKKFLIIVFILLVIAACQKSMAEAAQPSGNRNAEITMREARQFTKQALMDLSRGKVRVGKCDGDIYNKSCLGYYTEGSRECSVSVVIWGWFFSPPQISVGGPTCYSKK